MRAGLLAVLLVLAAPLARSDAVVFVNGDRISGQILAKGTKRIRLRTPYGLLAIPRTEIQRLIYDDGREEVLNPAVSPPPLSLGLVILVSGDSFWQAWKPAAVPADPSLRLSVRVDGQEVAGYLDVNLDPEDLPGAVVNTFVFDPERLFIRAAEGVQAQPPEPVRRDVRLALDLPAELAGRRRLSFVYQANEATSSDPRWWDRVQAESGVELSLEGPARVRVEQDRGLMEFAREGMIHAETFRAVARPEMRLP